jgi:hypothetical protein
VVLTGEGFDRRPQSEQPYTFRNAGSFSTIDYAYTRGSPLVSFEVARLVSRVLLN